jgi:hypothetical protein
VGHHVSRETRIKAIADVLSRPQATWRALPATGRLPHDVARVLAEAILEALAALETPLRTDKGMADPYSEALRHTLEPGVDVSLKFRS